MSSPTRMAQARAMDGTLQQMDRPLDASDMRSMIQAKSEVSNLRKLVGNLGTKLFGGPDMSEAARKAEKKKRDLEYKTNYLSGWRPLSSSQVNRRLKRISGKLDSAKYCKKGGDLKFEFEYAMTSFRGFYPRSPHKANQDYYILKPKLAECDQDWACGLFGVFDGHGESGDKCSRFVAKEIAAALSGSALKRGAPSNLSNNEKKDLLASGKCFRTLDDAKISECFTESFVGIDAKMHRQKNYGAFIDDEFSGTTAITCLLRDSSIIISNVGDSRAITGKIKKDGSITAMPLSMDQTPLRRDEYLRVKAAGAEVLSVDQLDGLKDPSIQTWDEGSDDPPRCWLPNQEYPGSAFTRSIGDRVAGTIGVFAEPEILCKNLSEDDRFILLASDGIFEFMSSQEVAEIVHQHDLDDASGCQKACDQLVKRSYNLWLQNDTRTDDITVILIRISSTRVMSELMEVEGNKEEEQSISTTSSAISSSSSGNHPQKQKLVRRGSITAFSSKSLKTVMIDKHEESTQMVRRTRKAQKRRKNKRNSMSTSMGASLLASDAVKDREHELSARIAEAARKRRGTQREANALNSQELKCVAAAMSKNFLFRSLSEDRAKELLKSFGRCEVLSGEKVIQIGDVGDRFYVAYRGKLDVSIPNDEGGNDDEKVITTYECEGTVDSVSSFGELALMYGTARTATVTAVTDCLLFALERSTFREALRKELGSVANTLHELDLFKILSISQMDTLVSHLPNINESSLSQVSMVQGSMDIDLGNGNRLEASVIDTALVKSGDSIPYNTVAELRAAQTAAFQRFTRSVKTLPPLGSSSDLKGKLRIEDLVFLGPSWTGDCGWQRLVWHRVIGRTFTLRSMVKSDLVSSGQHIDTVNEKRTLQALGSYGDTTKHIAALVGTCSDAKWIHVLIDCQAMVPIGDLWARDSSPHGLYLRRTLGCFEDSSSPGLGDSSATLYYAASLVLALGQLHGFNILYRGISPQRIFLSNTGAIQLTGFKFSKHLPGRTYTLCGDTEYMSPEQIEGSGHGTSSDWWALGVLVYEMICGRSPFAGKGDLTELEIYSNITAYNNDLKWDDSIKVSPETKSFVERALTRDISKRLDAVSAYKDPWFIKGGVVWAKLAKGESTFTNSNEKVPLHEELSKIHKAWKSDAMLPEGEVKAVVDDEEWFAEF